MAANLMYPLPGESTSSGQCSAFKEFIKTGQDLNLKMKYRQSLMCFTSALRLIGDKYQFKHQDTVLKCEKSQQFEEDVESYCNALSCAVETCLFLGHHEMARDLLCDYQFKTLFDCEIWPEDTDLVNWTLGTLYLNVGVEYVNSHSIAVGKTILEESKKYLMEFQILPEAQIKKAELLSLLGFCNLCLGSIDEAEDTLLDAIEMWRKLKFPLFAVDSFIINTMRSYIESKIRSHSPNVDANNVCTDLLQLHKALCGKSLDTQIPETFIYLGKVSFQKENEKSSLAFFEEALTLYKQLPTSESNKETILKLLRDVGVASYNCRDFQKAARSYKECLDMIKQTTPLSNVKLGQVAECYAALGFTYSRLRNFDKMLEYYEKALELQTRLATEDLELIETNIGNLYHVKAALLEKHGEILSASTYFTMAETAFTTALKYSWKSFPYINYGYYLLCRSNFSQAAHVLQQGYLNGVVDKDTVEFDHTEDPILLEDLQQELEGCEDIRMPSTIISLYLKVLAQQRLGDVSGAKHTANQLKHELQVCKFDCYYTEGFGIDRMKALCHSLLGYAYRDLGLKSDARNQFQYALEIMPEYSPASKNLQLLSSSQCH